MASLYVGDLHPEVQERDLYEKFCQAGQILSIRVLRDAVTRKSLGYAYVNYQQPDDARTALERMNFDNLNGQPIRIMWSNRDPATRRSGAGNIFIKNLDKSIDHKALHDTFLLFGPILSCKVVLDDKGESKGYGFVHFEDEKDANVAIEKVNGMLLADKQVYVAKFLPRLTRLKELGESTTFLNVFVKNFGSHLDKDGLVKLFGKFGEITSAAVMMDQDGNPKGFGFVAFKDPEAAEKACAELNGYQLEGTDNKLEVCRAQKKHERQLELKRRFELRKVSRLQTCQGVNLYVKNLDDSVNDEMLRTLFEPYGTIVSCKVMTDERGLSKGFGFVCFEKTDEATKAVSEMNTRKISTKLLYVAPAQRKEDRRAQLASQYMLRVANMRITNNGVMPPQSVYPAANTGYFLANPINNPGPGFGAMPMSGAMMNSHPQRWQPQRPHMPPMHGMPPHMAGRRSFGPRPGPHGSSRYNNQHPGQNRQRYYGDANGGQGLNNGNNLSLETLSQATPQEQKQRLGEAIHTKLTQMFPSCDAGKITGMILEIDNSELLLLLNDEDLFKQRVQEAIRVHEESLQNLQN